MDDDQAPPEVTISPAENGHVVRWHQRSGKKGESGRSISRVALSADEALDHAKSALGGGSAKSSKKRSIKRDGQSGVGFASDAEGGESDSAPAAHASRAPRRSSARRRRSRAGRRA